MASVGHSTYTETPPATATATATVTATATTTDRRTPTQLVDHTQVALFLRQQSGRSLLFDHGMGLQRTVLPKRPNTRGDFATDAQHIATAVAQVLTLCVATPLACPSADTHPMLPKSLDEVRLEAQRTLAQLQDSVGVNSLVGSSRQKQARHDSLPVFGLSSLMSSDGGYGTCAAPVQDPDTLLFGSNYQLATRICCHNRHYAEHSGYFQETQWYGQISRRQLHSQGQYAVHGEKNEDEGEAWAYFDSVTGKHLFTAPIGRSFEDFYEESLAHGWPSFRDEEVDWENVRSLRNGEIVSTDGTHLGHNIPDDKGNRYCINLVCISGRNRETLNRLPDAVMQGLSLSTSQRLTGMLWGLFSGNAVGMPSMWFYQSPAQIIDAFGPAGVTGLTAPPSNHPGSIMSDFWRANRENVRQVVGKIILHGREEKWQRRGEHYHSGLRAGDNTLNIRLVEVLMNSIIDNQGEYDPTKYLREYIHFMTTPGTHEDTYADTAHIQFFYKLSQGKDAEEATGVENHSTGNIGSTVSLPVLVATALQISSDSVAAAEQRAINHVQLTHQSDRLLTYVRVMAQLFVRLLSGVPIREAVRLAGTALGIDFDTLIQYQKAENDRMLADTHQDKRFPLPLPFRDLPVVVKAFGLACYIHDALPTALFLAFKYDQPTDAVAGLLANANIGGNTADRGAVLGAIYGAVSWTQT